MSRGGYKISRSDYDVNKEWADRLYNIKSENQMSTQTLLDQMNAIMSKGPYFPNVQSKVDYYQEKTGLKEFLSKNKKIAQNVPFGSLSQELKNKLITYLTNKVESVNGLITIPVIQDELFNTFKHEGLSYQDLTDEASVKFINNIILSIKDKSSFETENSPNIGKPDTSPSYEDSQDFFKGMIPNQK